MDTVKLGKYQRYKGQFYKVIWIAKHSETLEELVVYIALYTSEEFGDNAMRVRPKDMFFEDIVVNWVRQPRFKFISNI